MKIAQPTTPLAAANRLQRARKRHHPPSPAAISRVGMDCLASRLRGTLSSTVLMGTPPSGEIDASLGRGYADGPPDQPPILVVPIGVGRWGKPHPRTGPALSTGAHAWWTMRVCPR